MKYFLPGYLRLVVVSLIVFAINVVIFTTGWFLNSLNVLPELLVKLYSNPLIFWVLYIILFYSILHIDTKEKERSNLENLQQEVGGLKNTEQIPKTQGKFDLDSFLKISLIIFAQLLLFVIISFLLFAGRENVPAFWTNVYLIIFYGLLASFFFSLALLVIKLFRSGQKGPTIAVLTITSLIILAIVVTYLQFYERDKTADWKTYTNDIFGFTLKYPDDKFEVAESNCGNDANLSLCWGLYKPEEKDLVGHQIKFISPQVQVFKNSDSKDLTEWLEENTTTGQAELGTIAFQNVRDKEFVTVAGQEAVRFVGDNISYPNILNVVLIRNGVLFNFYVSNEPDLVKTFDLMLSTFKFI